VFKHYSRRYQAGIALTALAAIIGLAAGVFVPIVTKNVIDLVDKIVRGLQSPTSSSALLPLTILLLALGLLQAAMNYARRNIAQRVSFRMETDMRNDLYAHLQRLSVSFHQNWQSGQLLARAVYDIASIRRFAGFGFVFLFVSLFTFAAVFVALFSLNPMLAGVTALIVLPVGVLSLRFEREYRVIARQVQDQQGDLSTLIEETATGVRIIKAFGRGPEMMARFKGEALQLRATNLRAVRSRGFYWSLLDLVPNVNLVVITILGGLAVIGGHLSIGGLVAFLAYLGMLVFPLEILGWVLAMGEEAITAADRVYEVFDAAPEIQDAPGAAEIRTCAGHVLFDHVRLRYGMERGEVLADVNLELKPGETIALVGRTGSGKTSLASLLPRLQDVTSGSVRIDGVDIRSVTLRSLRSHIGVAFEDPILFSASVRENLLMGRPDATEAELDSALRTTRSEFVYELPWGLDTRVGEQGYTLSGGQRQRLALARAVLGRPEILVLDDPLSSVDVHTEAEIEAALAGVLEGVTALLVVHRPSTLALADRVALLDEGTIAAVGTHHELLQSQPLYRAILSQEAERSDALDTAELAG
jgi:ATP-binding cassette subfamily B protein